MTPTALDDKFANEMIVGSAVTQPYRPRGRLLLGLLLVCLAPRVWMAARLDTVCNDAVFYIQLAEGIERGDLDAGLGQLRLNTYPPALALFHWLGLDWELAGKCWGVALSSLAVLPLFGWLRRQFNEQLAVVGCLLYAFHPKLVEWSPELIRDPTFWFFWTLSLYTSWRAAAETRLSWYLLAGVVITLAAHTRFEGWSLYLPLLGWSAWRQLAARKGALRAVAGCSAAVAVCPVLLVIINLTWLAGQPSWELGNFARLDYVAQWSEATWRAVNPGPQADADGVPSETVLPATPASSNAFPETTAAAVTTTMRMSVGQTLWVFVNALRRGFGALFGICWVVGFACRPRLWLRRDHLILFLVAGCVAAGTWVHLWYAQATSSRYFLALVLLGAPCAAMGCAWTCRRLEQTVCRLWDLSLTWRSRRAAVAAIAGAALLGNIAETLASRYEGRQREAALGLWILAEFGPGRQIVTPRPLGLLGFYAHATTRALTVEPAALDGNVELAVVLPQVATPQETEAFVEAAASYGLRPIDHRCLPHGHDWSDVVVMARTTCIAGSLCNPRSAFRTL